MKPVSEEIEFLKSVGYKEIWNSDWTTCYGLHDMDNNFINHSPGTDNFVIGGAKNFSFIEAVKWLGLYNEYKLWKRSKVIKELINQHK